MINYGHAQIWTILPYVRILPPSECPNLHSTRYCGKRGVSVGTGWTPPSREKAVVWPPGITCWDRHKISPDTGMVCYRIRLS
jgi:hypothetical protein